MTSAFRADPLDPASVRVLGSLAEKAFTTPDNYPLTLNALMAACNQTSNREPVLALTEANVLEAVAELRARSLVSEVFRSDSRAKRYRHLLSETLKLHPAEMAVLCVLLLRGAQTAGEIRTRTARLHQFDDLPRLELTLDALMTLSEPLVVQLPRRPGQKEARYAHLLAGEPLETAESRETAEPARPEAGSSPRAPNRVAALEQDVGRPRALDRVAALEEDVRALRAELAALEARFDEFRRQFL
jgi:uncharacterized protein YceH (UPF0502 family)